MMSVKFTHYRIHLLVSDLYPGDAIGNFVLAVRDMLREHGLAARLYAERCGAALTGVQPYAAFFASARPGDVLFYQLSNHDPALPAIMAASCRKVVYYHNITPGHFFAPYSPETAELLDAGRRSLSLVAAADAVLANSRYSLKEIEPFLRPEAPRIAFPPFLSSGLPFKPDEVATADAPIPVCVPGGPYLLTLGRVVPHKRVEKAIAIFARIRKRLLDMRLVVAGSKYEPYAEKVHRLAAEQAGEGNVIFTGKLESHEVAAVLRNASGLLHTSAHEGFCMPVLEAMLAGIPVFAHNQNAVAETLGGTGILFDTADAQSAAEVITKRLSNPADHKEVLAMQKARAREICNSAADALLLGLLIPAYLQGV